MKFIIALALGLSSVMALRYNAVVRRHNEEGNDVSGDSGV